LPSGVGLKVKYQIGSGNLKVGSDSIRNGEGTFTSQNYETSTKKVEINIELGSGNININY
jgi:predicted membrane protein